MKVLIQVVENALIAKAAIILNIDKKLTKAFMFFSPLFLHDPYFIARQNENS